MTSEDSTGELAQIFNDALALQNQGKPAEAIPLYRDLTKRRLTASLAHNLGLCLVSVGQYEEAERWLGLAARSRAGDPNFRRSLGIAYSAQNRPELAELEFRTALALKPDFASAQLELAGLCLSLGRYAEGWPLLEARAVLHPKAVPPGPASFPQWRGEPLDGKSIIVCFEQGFGDQIQTVRFVRSLKQRGAARVTLCCRPPLAALFASIPDVDMVIPLAINDAVIIARHDYWSRYFSLPHHLGVTLENMPAEPYIAAPADRRDAWRSYRGIGVFWKASVTGATGASKTLPARDVGRLMALGAVSLQPEDTGAADFADTAAIIEQLDLVISVDTAVAHLAGAMGKPCWTLLPFLRTDWRWLRGRADSPWYPSMRLYRQARPGDWADVIDTVSADLIAFRGG